MKKTKIICTLGPASYSPGIIKQMVVSGMDIARLNCSHGDVEAHKASIEIVRQVSEEIGKHVGILLDIRGPKIRIGSFRNGSISLLEGQTFTLTTEDVEGDQTRVSVLYPSLVEDLSPGMTVYVNDGLVHLDVVNVTDTDIICKVIVGGELGNGKGVTLPGVPIRLPPLTDKDIEDIRFGIAQGVDFIAASFVRKAQDVLECRRIMGEHANRIKVIAKIESSEGIENIDEIIDASDGIMIARGDMGVEIPVADVPLVQKMIIRKCNDAGKPVITATQMLESMTHNANPTRAEVTDIANAILDGTDAIMLSGETAVGKYPVGTVRMMATIAERAEKALNHISILQRTTSDATVSVADAISHATCQTAHDLHASAIISSTQTGSTASMVSKYRPSSPIIAATPDIQVARRLSLWWGVYPVLVPRANTIDEMLDLVIEAAKRTGLVKDGVRVVITAGVRTGVAGSTNLLQVLTL
jgi:pyruvate kinase